MTDEEKHGVDFTILAMESVYNFITSLLTEQNVNELVKNATPDVTPTVTHDGTLH
jgi:hypothetical protein